MKAKKEETPVVVVQTHALARLRSEWIEALARYRLVASDETHNALRQAERDYVFLWRRTRHKIIFGARAFKDRAWPKPIYAR